MACDSQRLILTAEPQAIAHSDTDYSRGTTVVLRCDTAVVHIGGQNVSPANSYQLRVGEPFGLTDSTDVLYACVDPMNAGVEAFLFWAGV